MTGWDVADTAVKIGLASIITAAATIIGVWVSRSTDLKKDARRRRQDAIEMLIDKFESAHSATTQILSVFLTYASISRENNLGERKNCLEEAQVRVRAFMDAKGTLFSIVGRCQIMKLSQCSHALGLYLDVIGEVNAVLDFHSVITEDAATNAERLYPKLEDCRRQIHNSLSEAFYAV
jgi:hypothetical protein